MNLKGHCSVILLSCLCIASVRGNAEEAKLNGEAEVESASEIVKNHLPFNIEWLEFDSFSDQGDHNLEVRVVDSVGSFETTRCIYFRGWVKHRLLMDAIKKCSVVTQKFEPIGEGYPGQHVDTVPLWWRQPGEVKTKLDDWWRRRNRIVQLTLLASNPEGAPDAIMMLAGRLEYSAFPTNGNLPEKEWLGPKPKNAEQDGTGQPATRPESNSKGGDKPQPEAEGRSR